MSQRSVSENPFCEKASPKTLECDGYGCVPAQFMFIGISAGRLGALQTKVPLTKDASGRIFQRCLRDIGLSDSEECSLHPRLRSCYITNLVKSRVLTAKGLNRLPTTKEVYEWMPYLRVEIDKVEPKKIFALGDFVARHLNFANIPFVKVKHPRWYQAHGALDPSSTAYQRMVCDYQTALKEALQP